MSQPSIKKNYIYNTLYEILAIISPLITAPYVSRILEADGVGIFSRTHANLTFFTMFAALGIKSYGQREIAQHRDNKEEASRLFWELELMCASTTLISLIAWVILIFCSKGYAIYYTVLTITLIATAFDISWFWGGQEQYRFIVIRNSLIKIIGIVMLFAFIHKKEDLLLYIFLIAITGLFGNLSMWSYLRKYLVKVDFRTLNVRRHYRETLVYFVPTVASSIYTGLDKAMIGWIIDNDYENGYYEQATKIMNICKSLVFSINTVMSSRMSFLFAKNMHKEIKEKMETTMNFILLISIPIVFGLLGIAKTFIPFYFGDGYEDTIPILCIMSPLLIVIGISNCLGGLYFTPSGQRARSNKAIITGAVVNLIFNSFLIYFFQAMGAAIASLIAELTITSMYLFMSRNYFDISCIVRFAWKRVIAGGVMLFVVKLLSNSISSNLLLIVVQVAAGALTYGILLLCMRDTFLLENIQKILDRFVHRKKGGSQ